MRFAALFLLTMSAVSAQTPSISGDWTFTAQSSLYGITITATGVLTQNGSSFSGNLTISGSPCGTSGTITGTLVDGFVSATLVEGNSTVDYSGNLTPDGNSAGGGYQASPGCADSDFGDWTATKGAATPVVSGAVSAADYNPSIAVGEYIAIFGSGLSNGNYSASPPYPSQLGQTQVLACGSPPFGCVAQQIAYASPGQINIVLTGVPAGQQFYFSVVVGNQVASATPMEKPFASFPSMFIAGYDCWTDPNSASGYAEGGRCGLWTTQLEGTVPRAVITDLKGNLVWSGNPAHVNGYYTLWLTGLGVYTNGVPAVQLQTTFDFPNPNNGQLTTELDTNPLYSGSVAQFPGLYQINFQIPAAAFPVFACGNYHLEINVGVAALLAPNSKSSDSNWVPLVLNNGDVPCH